MPTAREYEDLIQQLDWDGLRNLWDAIARHDTPDWEEGKAFEYLVLRAFQLDRARVRWPYRVDLDPEGGTVEQIDGAVHWQNLSCLVESKDHRAELANIEPIAKLRHQLLRRPSSTIGLVFSRTGFTKSARFLARFNAPQTILLWDGEEIRFLIARRRICNYLLEKYLFCIETGVPYYDIRTIEIT
jgi:hypothetical protein